MTPEISEDVEDLQAVESMTIHGALGSGALKNLFTYRHLYFSHFTAFSPLLVLEIKLNLLARRDLKVLIEGLNLWSWGGVLLWDFQDHIYLNLRSQNYKMQTRWTFKACFVKAEE